MSGKKLDYLGVSAFCESMAMMIQAGIQTDEAITLLQSERTHGSGVLEEGLCVMKQQVDQGFGLAAAMKESGIFPDYALRMVQAGESSGRLEDNLFEGSEGVVTKVDYRKERARVDFRFESNACHTWIALDGIRK